MTFSLNKSITVHGYCCPDEDMMQISLIVWVMKTLIMPSVYWYNEPKTVDRLDRGVLSNKT
jgi:hypothetical protein